MQYQFQIRKNRLVASLSLVLALLATTVISAGVASLADAGVQQDNTAIVVTATRLAPGAAADAANSARALRAAAAGATTQCRAVAC